jgi:hypothetical protein
MKLPAKFGEGIRHQFSPVEAYEDLGEMTAKVPNSLFGDLGKVQAFHNRRTKDQWNKKRMENRAVPGEKEVAISFSQSGSVLSPSFTV